MFWMVSGIYFPVLVAVVSWIVAVYICMLFGWKNTPENLAIVGGIAFIVIFSINYFSAVLGGFFQNFSTILKVMLLGVLASIAFSYDGWVVSTSISHEIKNSRKNLPIALILGTLFVLVAYIFYFTGISVLLGPEEIMRLGDNHVNAAVTMVFGEAGAKVFLIFVIISVLGTLNGFTLGSLRMPYSLAIRNMFP